MKQGRTPDRVHVVARPAQDDYRAENGGTSQLPTTTGTANPRAMEIIRTLAAISDKLKRSEAERYELLAELREYRKSLNEIEEKFKAREAADTEVSQRQARFERALKETENKLVQASAGQNLLVTRIKETEDKQVGLVQRIDESVVQQARIDRQVEKMSQDKTRVLRKVERMEEILTETQDTLKARALVLLTDHSAAAVPALTDQSNLDGSPWWRRSVRMQGVGMVSMVVAALLFGWSVNQWQQPDVPKIAVLENGGGLAQLNKNNEWEPIATNNTASQQQQPITVSETQAEPTLTPVDPSTFEKPSEQTPAAQNVLNSSDDQLMAALEENPEQLAAQLNEIAPEAQAPEAANDLGVPPEAQVVQVKTGFNPLKAYENKAFIQDPKLANDIAKEKGTKALAQRMQPDASLPANIKALEEQAFAGVPEAQHDLAAIYTAGRGGVTQNFEKAGFWFREAADQKIANADYNLGVLYHQGLGVERDLDRALFWYREAAKLGHPEAQYNLGIAHIEGIGTDYDAPLAAAFFESAANQGIVEAAYNLGLIYENGLISGAKPQEAMLWYKIAADGGSTDAKAALAQLASSLKISDGDINRLVDKMQGDYASEKGRRAGPDKAKPAA